MRLAFIGGGNMATALIGGLLARGSSASEICVADVDEAQRERLQQRFGVATRAEPAAAVVGAEVVVLAVKPQQMRAVARELAPWVRDALIVSIAAGIRAVDLSRWLDGHARIVRTMPNTPALVGAGVTALAASPSLSEADREAAAGIMAAVGDALWVEDEALIDAVTAVSGSGPAYVFYFMEAMIDAGTRLGLTAAQARRLTIATFAGASRLAAESEDSPATLRERVTSRGGTTAAAIAQLASHRVADHVVEAIEAAQRRSVELGEAFGNAQDDA
ncbi:MAG: pyrroline-5-carboxylate reductase [Burkholderiales bacterium]|nr:MAG: pyrroline-5-carboxylate reductase [Burkholderiales bacterium]